MEKFTIRSTYSEASLYGRWTASAPGKPKPAEPVSGGNPDDGAAGGTAARNADGDTFTLSIEARQRSPGLADAADVAARAAEHWDREFAGRPGSRRDFAAGVRAGLDRWAAGCASARPPAQEYRSFRSEVAVEIRARLEIWSSSAAGTEERAAPGPGSE